MNKNYYYQKMLEELEKQEANNKKSLLLHSCCAVCSSWVVYYLSQYFKVTILFNNSNIYPQKEYEKRLTELKRYINESNLAVEIVIADYQSDYQKQFMQYKDESEGLKRCKLCIEKRMDECYTYAQNNGFDYFTTVMSISTNKDSLLINQIGEKLQNHYTVKYLYSDFKKDSGNLKTSKIVQEYSIYRQNYCGCIYSLRKPENTTLDYLCDRDVFLFQRKDMFRFNTDTKLLGEYIKVLKDEVVLDVGCNNGVLMLYASAFDYMELVGIDVLQQAIELAEYNMHINEIENYRLINDSIINFDEQVDVIICNPPYFDSYNNISTEKNEHLKTARHFTTGNINNFIKAFKRILKPKGRIYMIYRYDLWQDVEKLFESAGFYVDDKKSVYEERKNRYQSVLVTIKNQ